MVLREGDGLSCTIFYVQKKSSNTSLKMIRIFKESGMAPLEYFQPMIFDLFEISLRRFSAAKPANPQTARRGFVSTGSTQRREG